MFGIAPKLGNACNDDKVWKMAIVVIGCINWTKFDGREEIYLPINNLGGFNIDGCSGDLFSI